MRNLLLVTMVLLLAACGGATAVAPPRAAEINCTAAYRPDVSQPILNEVTVTLADRDDEQTIPFADLIFHAAYRSGEADNERNLRLWVTDVSGTAVFQSQLFQLPPDSGPQNQFVGGHGFTGLTYSYHPTSAAELQFWCQAP